MFRSSFKTVRGGAVARSVLSLSCAAARGMPSRAAVFSRMRPKHPRAPLSAERAERTSDTRRNAAAYARHGTQMPL